jgi:predicted small metal-binding protein
VANKVIRLRCPCGEVIEAQSEDELVEKANAHLEQIHPDIAGSYTRDQILFMAY